LTEFILLTSINVRNNNFGSLICEKSSSFGANTLAGASNDGYLACKKAMRVVEVTSDLCCTLCHDDVILKKLFATTENQKAI
jgi:hypothetical protein